MKYSLFIVVLLSFIGCKKENPNDFVADPADYYQSQGNLLILVVTQGELEEAYEYQLDTISYVNDSISLEATWPFPAGSGSSGVRYTILHPHSDTLCTDQDWHTTFPVTPIASTDLYRSGVCLPFDNVNEQDHSGQDNSVIWNVVANLEILNSYRVESPDSPVVFWYKSALHLNNQGISTLTGKTYVMVTK